MKKIPTIAACLFVIITGCGEAALSPIVLSPEPPQQIQVRVFDPQSGLTVQPPGDSDWSATVRWQGPVNQTFKQVEYDYYSSAINTHPVCKINCKLPFRSVVGGGPHNVVTYDRVSNPQPINKGISLTWNQSVDAFETVGGVGQLSMIMYIRYKDSNVWAIVINTWDNRIESLNYTPFVASDTYTWFLSLPISNSLYITSNQPHTYLPTQRSSYNVTITPQQFQMMLDLFANNGIIIPSRNLDDYGITLAGMLHEIFTFNDPAVYVKSYTTFSTVRIETLP